MLLIEATKENSKNKMKWKNSRGEADFIIFNFFGRGLKILNHERKFSLV